MIQEEGKEDLNYPVNDINVEKVKKIYNYLINDVNIKHSLRENHYYI